MKKTIFSHLIVLILASSITWLYCRFSAPRFWDQQLDMRPAELMTLPEKNVYWTHAMKEVRFTIKPGDKCFYVSNYDFSFGEPDAELMGYEYMIVFCPGKGAGWVKNVW